MFRQFVRQKIADVPRSLGVWLGVGHRYCRHLCRGAGAVLIISFGLLFFGCGEEQRAVQIELNAAPWVFSEDVPPASTLSPKFTQSTFNAPPDSSSFTIRLVATLGRYLNSERLLYIPGVLEVSAFQHDPSDRTIQNYPAYPMPDGSVSVFQAALRLHPLPNSTEKEVRDMVIGIPLGILTESTGQHEIVLHFSGVRWSLYVDGELLDNDFPLGYPQWPAQHSWEIDPNLVSKAELFFPGLEPEKTVLKTPRVAKDIQYWTPAGHNTWVGDVATFYHEGRYHVFYLFDRRGHASKFGRGGHYFEHLSTSDFVTWTEHEAATPIESQWETLGTGTPFISDGELCISYGLHTTRIFPKEATTLPRLLDYYNQHGATGSFGYDTLSGYPAGSTYSISADGISQFKKTHTLFHHCENPSVYTDPEGRLRMLANYGAKGTWESKSIEGDWKSINPGFPPGGDCTFFFRWGNYDYVIGGFTGLWSKPASAPEDGYTDVVKQGLDFYNGMCVPAVTEINDGRFLMAGWIPMANWGGTLNIHEMLQFPDGRIGTKWMEELVPVTERQRTLADEIEENSTFEVDDPSFLLTFDVKPGEELSGKLGALFLGEDDAEHACEFQLRPHEKRAQYGKGSLQQFSEREKTLREGGFPNHARHYGIENLFDTDGPFSVRMFVKYDTKYGGSQIDAEIAGKRTMITFCPGLKVEKLLFRSEDTGIRNVKLAAYEH